MKPPKLRPKLKQTRPYYDSTGAGERLKRKIEITRRLSQINILLRSETGDERNELRKEQEDLQEEYKNLEV